MDMNLYGLEHQAADKLREARAQGEHARLVAALSPPRPGAVAVVGLGLIKLGRFMQRRSSRRRAEQAPVQS
jgi:hypothetical protein